MFVNWRSLRFKKEKKEKKKNLKNFLPATVKPSTLNLFSISVYPAHGVCDGADGANRRRTAVSPTVKSLKVTFRLIIFFPPHCQSSCLENTSHQIVQWVTVDLCHCPTAQCLPKVLPKSLRCNVGTLIFLFPSGRALAARKK